MTPLSSNRCLSACIGLATIAAVLALASGCNTSFPRVPWRQVRLDVRSGLYDVAALTYRLDAGKLGQPLDVLRVDGPRVSYEQVASSPLPDESIGTLSIVYPHPSGNNSVALARFVLDSAPTESASTKASWNPWSKKAADTEMPAGIAGSQPEVHETWELDISHQELDQTFKAITNAGFYQLDRPGPARLTVKMDGVEQSKDWSEIPALNLLVQRIRSQGQLVSYTRPRGANGASAGTIASTQAYSRLLADIGTAPAAPAHGGQRFLAAAGRGAGGGYVPAPAAPGYPSTPYPPALAQRPPPGPR